MSFPLVRNPSRIELLRLAGPGGSIRAIHDPASGACFAWNAVDARHAEAAILLGLDFRTRQELQRHSFVVGYEQLQGMEAEDLEGVLRALKRQPSGRQ